MLAQAGPRRLAAAAAAGCAYSPGGARAPRAPLPTIAAAAARQATGACCCCCCCCCHRYRRRCWHCCRCARALWSGAHWCAQCSRCSSTCGVGRAARGRQAGGHGKREHRWPLHSPSRKEAHLVSCICPGAGQHTYCDTPQEVHAACARSCQEQPSCQPSRQHPAASPHLQAVTGGTPARFAV